MGAIASQITSLTIVYSTVNSDADQSSAGLCVGNSPVTSEFPAQMASNAEMFPFDDVIMTIVSCNCTIANGAIMNNTMDHSEYGLGQ